MALQNVLTLTSSMLFGRERERSVRGRSHQSVALSSRVRLETEGVDIRLAGMLPKSATIWALKGEQMVSFGVFWRGGGVKYLRMASDWQTSPKKDI